MGRVPGFEPRLRRPQRLVLPNYTTLSIFHTTQLSTRLSYAPHFAALRGFEPLSQRPKRRVVSRLDHKAMTIVLTLQVGKLFRK